MKTYILIDTYNLFFRAMHTTNEQDIEMCKGLCLHTLFSMIKKACDKFSPDCLIACRDGNGTWRKDVYPLYKANRIERLQERTPYEIERDEALKEVFENDFLPFISEKTNIPMLSYEKIEADDLISNFIQLHPNDVVIILSTDNDFVQLLNDNVFIYNSMDDRIISNKCVLDSEKKRPLYFTLKEGKISVPKEQPKELTELTPYNDWVDYALFMKCIRGDKSDNIFSAYPGIREKSTKNKVGIRDAFLDRESKGYNWTTFMNSSWDDPFGNKHIVKEEYEKNKKIIDLKELPQDLKQQVQEYIVKTLNQPSKSCIGIELIKYLKKWNLINLEKDVNSFSSYFQKGYNNG